MTAPPSKDGSSLSSSKPDHPGQSPLASSLTPAVTKNEYESGSGGAGPVERQQAAAAGVSSSRGLEASSGKQQHQRPWWKTRRAKLACAVVALLLPAFVILLPLGLLGYLRKVGPFSSFNAKGKSSQIPANPLSTIPLMSDPFAIPASITPASPTPAPDQPSVPLSAGPAPTNQPAINANGPKAPNPTVNLGYTTYMGTTVAGGINRFLGMRFAAPPVGDLRWRPPVPPPNSTTVQSAANFGPICLGISVPLPNTAESEDCLFVNVWAPQDANTTSKLPVWLFIQGGGYVSNSNANWDGAEVIQQSGNKIVFVNFNYRVALWGFLASAKISANGALNAGLLDQRFLMQWVKDNIASFGGDPNNVIIHGGSAGAGSVALHLTAFGGRNDNLFSAAIAESVFFPSQPFVPQLEYQFDRLATATGCATNADQLTCLRNLDTKTLQAQNTPFPFPGRTDAPVPLFYWTPCIDGTFIQDLPYNLFAQQKFVRVPLLFGNSNNEGSVFAVNAANPAEMTNFLLNNYPMLSANDTDAIINLYPQQVPGLPNHDAWFPSASEAYGEATFICPAINVLAAYLTSATASNTDVNLWYYRYNVLDNNNVAAGVGVPHLWDSFAILGPNNLGMQTPPESYLTYNAPIVPVVMGYYLSFIQTHDPNVLRAPGSPAWDEWGTAGKNGSRLVLETGNTRMEIVPTDQTDRCAFWAGLAPRTLQKRLDEDDLVM